MASARTVESEQFDFASEGKARKRLRTVLLKYFPQEADVQFLIDECFGKRLEHIAEGSNFEETLYELILWLWSEPEQRLKPFLDAAKGARPNAAGELDAIAGSFAQSPASSTSVSLHDTIRQFLEELSARTDLFRYLNAYKELHEVIHDLQRSRPRIGAAVSRRIVNPVEPLSDDVAYSFNEWIARATQCTSETEFPDDPPEWIQSLAGAAAILAGSDTSRWSWAMERLQAIPPREMGRLNGRLIDNARRLRCEQLIQYLDAILAAIAGAKMSSTVADIDARVRRFRDLCGQLVQLVRIHDLCQRIDDLLGEAAGLEVVTPKTLMGWGNIGRRLNELGELSPDNFRIKRTRQAADNFGAAQDDAAAAVHFAALTEHFADLFHDTDKSLLKVSNRIGNEVSSLDRELRKFL